MLVDLVEPFTPALIRHVIDNVCQIERALPESRIQRLATAVKGEQSRYVRRSPVELLAVRLK
ncbi:MAG: hypothetical protein RLN70_10485, partial [Rhodospirillaceae bacterium]